MTTTVLTTTDIRKIVHRVGLDAIMDTTIQRLTNALRDFDPGRTRVAVRDGFAYTHPVVGLLEWMPVLEIGGHATVKMVAYHPANPDLRGIPTIVSTLGQYDCTTGQLLGMVDGTYLTAVRTGAASAVASRVLASPRSRVLGLVGGGAQAVTQLHAHSRLFDLERVHIYDIDPAVSRSFPERVSALVPADLPIEISSLETVVASSDILCTQTSVEVGQGPVFADRDTKPHLHVNAVGSDFPRKTELPLSLLQRSFVSPDFLEQAVKEGECQSLTPEQIGPSLAELIKSPDTYRSRQEEATVFDSTGFALEDHVVACMIFDYARDLGLGTPMEIESIAEDPRDPYGFTKSPIVRRQAV